MSTRLRNWIGGLGLLVVLVGTLAWLYLPGWLEQRQIARLMAVDVSGMDAAAMEAYVRSLPADRMSWDQKMAVFEKLRGRFEKMPAGERFKLMAKAMEAMEKEPTNPLIVNGRELMRAQFRTQMAAYMSADAKRRREILDKEIDRQVMMENMQKMGQAVGSIFGRKSTGDAEGDAARDRLRTMGRPDDSKIRNWVAEAMSDSMKNGSPEDRAAASQYFLDMRQRRIDRGLPVRF